VNRRGKSSAKNRAKSRVQKSGKKRAWTLARNRATSAQTRG
jgi:hypothetical protein